MRFVKASEQLPKYDEILHVKVDGMKRMGNFWQDTDTQMFFHVFNEQNSFDIPQHKFDRIEWLKEDEQDEGWVPVEQFADFLDTERNKGLDGRGKESLWNDMKIWGNTTAFKLMLEKFKDRQPPATT